jgi:hypothetical protein
LRHATAKLILEQLLRSKKLELGRGREEGLPGIEANFVGPFFGI